MDMWCQLWRDGRGLYDRPVHALARWRPTQVCASDALFLAGAGNLEVGRDWMKPAQLLWRLFEMDQEIQSVQQAIGEVRSKLGVSRPVQEARERLAEAERRLKRTQQQQSELDDELAQVTQKLAASEKALYEGQGRHPKELQSLQEEVTYLSRRSSRLQESLLEVMEGLEEARQEYQRAQELLASVEQEWRASQGALAQELEQLERRLGKLERRREDWASMLAPEHLRLYDELCQRKSTPLARLQNGICQACGIRLPVAEVQRARDTDELVYCSQCGRLLVAE
jgi:predicted  nucleic acid-binding Zn-ribbon protein